MNYEKLWNDLWTEAKKDAEYQKNLEAVVRAETDYLAVCETLRPEHRAAIEDYISACEAQDDYLITLAYRLGKWDN